LDPSQFLNANNKHDGAPSEDVMFVRPGNDDNAEDDGGDVHLGRISRNDCSATFLSGTPVVNIFNNNNTTPLSPLSVGVDAMQLPERPSLSPVSASTTNKKSKDVNHQRSSQEISFIPVEEDDLTGTLYDWNTVDEKLTAGGLLKLTAGC
jgi:hypothetical protein